MKSKFSLAELRDWLRRRVPELAVFLFGVFLRVTMAWRYDATWSYDSNHHWAVVQWILDHGRVPPPTAVFSAFHPPLFYATAAWLFRHGATRDNLVWLSIACGTVRLGLIWAGLELYLPSLRWARVSALALAAVTAASIHIDGMVYPEAMSGMWIAAAMLVTPLAFSRAKQWRWACCVGFFLGLAMLTKISAMAVIASVGAAALAEFVFSRDGSWARLAKLLPWVGMLAVCVGISGWYFARNVRVYHTPFITSFELSQKGLLADSEKVPYFDRRSLGFFIGWDPIVFLFPYYPSGLGTHPRFFPVAVASTFVDYWNYSFSGIDPKAPNQFVYARDRPMTSVVLATSRLASIGGTVIFLATVAAWGAATCWVFRRRRWGLFALLLVPPLSMAAAMHFAITYPIDRYGVVKAVYMQYGAPPMYALFGVAVAWAQRQAVRWPLLGVMAVAWWMVASYSFYCRTGVRLG